MRISKICAERLSGSAPEEISDAGSLKQLQILKGPVVLVYMMALTPKLEEALDEDERGAQRSDRPLLVRSIQDAQGKGT